MAIGLYTHIQANRLRSALLLACFAGLFLVLAFALALAFESFGDGALDEIVARAFAHMIWAAPATLAGVAVWFAIAWRWHARLAARGTGADPMRPGDAPRLRHALETLCISRGLPTPRLEIIETDALNAYACGLTQADVTIAVTRGLILALEPDELEAVLAHEVAHILNRDTQLLTIAVIFVGIFGVFGMARHLDAPRTAGRRSKGGSRKDSGRAAALAIAIALVVLAGMLARLLRFAVSRLR